MRILPESLLAWYYWWLYPVLSLTGAALSLGSVQFPGVTEKLEVTAVRWEGGGAGKGIVKKPGGL